MKKSKGFLIVPIFLLIVSLLLLLTNLIPEESIDTTVKLFLTLIVLELFVFALPSFFYAKLRGDKLLTVLPKNGLSLQSIPLLLATVFLILFFGLSINSIFFFIGIGKESYTSLGPYALSSVSIIDHPLYALVAYGAIPALVEEFFFRGIVYGEYRSYSFLTASLVSSLAFAFCYFDLAGFPFYFVSGFLLAYTVRLTNSLFAAITVRFFVNVASIYLMPTLWRLLTQPLGVLFAVFVSVTLFLIALFFYLKALATRYLAMARDPAFATDTPYSKKEARYHTLKALTSPLFLATAAIWLTAVVIDFFI